MRRFFLLGAALSVAVLVPGSAAAHGDASELPEGPIRERHELMEEIGQDAKIIGEAMKTGDTDKVSRPAMEIENAAAQIPALFPDGSTHTKSRARPEIWTDPKGFAFEVRKLQTKAAALAVAADKKEGVPEAASDLFGACKSCHNNFRVPEE